ncbi:hypothetical protein HE1_00529 [Holospora elegans E1]|uniref:Uncharacterized protein n=1 Tax=Holospora elegans E1 TaxID=1427503 RepID=A0A023DXN5_9PROT|nr:hypothetical protein HE1_00529 [Holospora elegans E1]
MLISAVRARIGKRKSKNRIDFLIHCLSQKTQISNLRLKQNVTNRIQDLFFTHTYYLITACLIFFFLIDFPW